MYDIIKNVITSGSYELTDILKKIDTIWLQSTLTEEQRTEFIESGPHQCRPRKQLCATPEAD